MGEPIGNSKTWGWRHAEVHPFPFTNLKARNLAFFSPIIWKHASSPLREYHLRFQTALNGTEGQSVAKTTGCGSSRACGITCTGPFCSCQTNAGGSSAGKVQSASEVRYADACWLLALPPSKRTKICARSFQCFLVSGPTGLKGIMPQIPLVQNQEHEACGTVQIKKNKFRQFESIWENIPGAQATVTVGYQWKRQSIFRHHHQQRFLPQSGWWYIFLHQNQYIVCMFGSPRIGPFICIVALRNICQGLGPTIPLGMVPNSKCPIILYLLLVSIFKKIPKRIGYYLQNAVVLSPCLCDEGKNRNDSQLNPTAVLLP